MKRLNNPVIPDYTPRTQKKEEHIELIFKNCCVCNVVIAAGYYGRWADGGTCSAKCDGLRQDMQLYLRDVP